MARAGLSNQLLGVVVVPKPDFGDPADSNSTNSRMWRELKPNQSGEWFATVDAVWTIDGTTKLAVHDAHGNTAEIYLTHVNIKV